MGIIYVYVTLAILTPHAIPYVPCRETTEWRAKCSWYLLLKFRMNFLLSPWQGAIEILLKVLYTDALWFALFFVFPGVFL